MKRLFAASLLVFLAVLAGSGQNKYLSYANERFSYSIEYPAGILRMQTPPANNDGRTFRSKDGKVEMRVWGQHNALGRNFLEEYEQSLKKCGRAKAYKDFREHFFVISCTIGSRIFYQKTMHRGDSGPEVFFTFTIEYPRPQKAKFDPIVARISRSFKFDPDAQI